MTLSSAKVYEPNCNAFFRSCKCYYSVLLSYCWWRGSVDFQLFAFVLLCSESSIVQLIAVACFVSLSQRPLANPGTDTRTTCSHTRQAHLHTHIYTHTPQPYLHRSPPHKSLSRTPQALLSVTPNPTPVPLIL